MNNNDQPDKDRQSSPRPEPQAPAGISFNSIEELKQKGREAAKARAEVAKEANKPQLSERLAPLREALLNTVLRGKSDREAPTPAIAEPTAEKPTVHDHQLRPPGTKPQPTITGPGEPPRFVRTVPDRAPAQPPTPAPNREPTNAEKLYAKIEQSLKDRGQLPPARPDRTPDRGHDVER